MEAPSFHVTLATSCRFCPHHSGSNPASVLPVSAGPLLCDCGRCMITCMSGGKTGEWGTPRNWVARVVGVRTTSDGAGSAWGVVAGMGGTPEQALAELRSEAESVLVREAGAVREANAEADEKAEKERAEGFERWLKARPHAPRGDEVPPHLAPRGPRREPEERRFEVVDVRLVPGVMENGGSGWLVYGTLVREDES
jgi:hypothetical protein